LAISEDAVYISGDAAFIKEFQGFLIENKIECSTPPTILKHHRVYFRKIRGTRPDFVFPDTMHFRLPSESIKSFLIAITPELLKLLYAWYVNRKSHGEIYIQTAQGTVIHIEGKGIRNFKFVEKRATRRVTRDISRKKTPKKLERNKKKTETD
jgi:hypothetical protein